MILLLGFRETPSKLIFKVEIHHLPICFADFLKFWSSDKISIIMKFWKSDKFLIMMKFWKVMIFTWLCQQQLKLMKFSFVFADFSRVSKNLHQNLSLKQNFVILCFVLLTLPGSSKLILLTMTIPWSFDFCWQWNFTKTYLESRISWYFGLCCWLYQGHRNFIKAYLVNYDHKGRLCLLMLTHRVTLWRPLFLRNRKFLDLTMLSGPRKLLY